MKRDKPFSKDMFILITLVLILNTIFIYDSPFQVITNIGSIIFIISIIFIMLKDIKHTNFSLNQLKQRTIQLENDMLKKSIQPHFLLNTLTILSEWIETKPKVALEQIRLLSNEFRYITNATKRQLVSVEEELNLCNNYLKMFNLKQEKNYILEYSVLDKNATIPPLIFHTIIENSLVHAEQSTSEKFIIEEFSDKDKTIYKIISPGAEVKEESKEGLGLNYIKSRLEISYPSSWSYEGYFKNGFWITEIGIQK